MRILKSISIPGELWEWLEEKNPQFTKKLSENIVYLIKKEFNGDVDFNATDSLIKRKAVELSKLQKKLNETKVEIEDVISTIDLLESKRKTN